MSRGNWFEVWRLWSPVWQIKSNIAGGACVWRHVQVFVSCFPFQANMCHQVCQWYLFAAVDIQKTRNILMFSCHLHLLGGLYCKYIFDFMILARSRDIFLHHHLRNNLLSRSEKACQNLIMTFWNDDSRKEEGGVTEEGWGVRGRWRERNKRGNWIWKREARLKKRKSK